MSDIDGPPWLVFQTRPRAERKVSERLVAFGIDVLVPMKVTVRQWSDRKKKVEEPLFPGYIFARVDERQRLAVLQTDGIARAVAFEGKAAMMRSEEIDTLRSISGLSVHVEALSRRAMPRGTDVLVINGPLKGARGIVSGSPRSLYLDVAVNAVQQSIRIQVPTDWLMRIAPR